MDETEKTDHTYRLLADPRVAILELNGSLTLKSLNAMVDRMYADPAYNPQCDCIVDLRNCTVDMDFAEVAQYAWRIRSHPQRVRGNAVFVTASQKAFGMSRMFAGFARDLLLGVHFTETLEEAFSWLESKRG